MENNHETDNNILEWPADKMPKLSKMQKARLKFLNKWGWAFNAQSRKRHRDFVKNKKYQANLKHAAIRAFAIALYEWGFLDEDKVTSNRHDTDDLVYVYPPESPEEEELDFAALQDCLCLDDDELKQKLTQEEIDALKAPRRASEIRLQLDDDEIKDLLEFNNLEKGGMVTIVRPLTTDGAEDLRAILELFEAMSGDENKILTQSEIDEILVKYAASKAGKNAPASESNFGITQLSEAELAALQDKKGHLAEEKFEFDESKPVSYKLDSTKLGRRF